MANPIMKDAMFLNQKSAPKSNVDKQIVAYDEKC